jgi:hypothetical protein
MGQAAKSKFSTGDFSSQFKNTAFDNNGEFRWSASSKLLQLLGYGRFDYQNMSFEDFSDKQVSGMSHLPNVSVFRLLAYHKICNDHYQFRQWQGYDASLCNVDYITPSGSMDLSAQLQQVDFKTGKNADRLNFLDLRFSNLPLDYLNGVLPTAQFGSESVVSLSGNNLKTSTDSNSWTFPTNGPSSSPVVTRKSSSSGSTGNLGWSSGADGGTILHNHTIPSDAISLSVLSLRQAYAAQKYKEIQLANDVDFASQIEAHFGVKPKHADDTSYFIGGSSSMIDINPIVNQNLSGDGQADYKASPIGNGSSKIKFTADTYGVVMGIYRCTPVLDYAHIGIDRTLCKTDATDFVIPEMDSIGMQQNYLFEVQAPSFDGVKVGFVDDQNFVKSYGYAPRYAEYKTNFDKYNGDFCYSLDSWVTGLPADMIDEICRHNLSSMQIAPELFNCRPSLCNSIFVNQNNYLVSDDKLYVGMVNMAYVTRNLSRYGLPYSN